MKRKEIVSYLEEKYGRPLKFKTCGKKCQAFNVSAFKTIFVFNRFLDYVDIVSPEPAERIYFNKIKHVISADGTKDRICKIVTLC